MFGVDDAKWGEMVQAAVRLTPGVIVNAADLITFVKAEIGSVKAPKVVHFVAELPRNAAGKVSRASVRALVQQPAPGVATPNVERTG